MKKSGISTAAGMMGVGVALLHLAACTAAKPPAPGRGTVTLGERGSLNGASLPPIQFTYEEMGDFPPVGSASIPAHLQLEQSPPLPPIEFKMEELGDFPPVGAPRLPTKPGIKQN